MQLVLQGADVLLIPVTYRDNPMSGYDSATVKDIAEWIELVQGKEMWKT